MNLKFAIELTGREMHFLADVAQGTPHGGGSRLDGRSMSGKYSHFVTIARQLFDMGLIEDHPNKEDGRGKNAEQWVSENCLYVLTARGKLLVEILRMESADLDTMFPEQDVRIGPRRMAS